MKKILMSLAIFGCMNFSAHAQQKSKFDENYPVCKNNGGYAICTQQQKAKQLKALQTKATADVAPLPETNQVVFVRCQSAVDEPSVTYNGPYRRHNIIVDEDMDNPYKGKPSRQNDGVQKNEERNLNVNQTSIDLPPNNGYTVK
jgi:hypothetical protein